MKKQGRPPKATKQELFYLDAESIQYAFSRTDMSMADYYRKSTFVHSRQSFWYKIKNGFTCAEFNEIKQYTGADFVFLSGQAPLQRDK